MSAPPHSREAERAVLGGVLLEPERLPSILSLVAAADFYDRGLALVFDAMIELHRRGEPIDTVILRALLSDRGELQRAGGDEALLALTNIVPTVANIAHHARIVREKATLRRIGDAGRAAHLSILSNDVDAAVASLAEAQAHAGHLARRHLVDVHTLRESGFDLDVEPPEPRWTWTRTDPDDGLEVGIVERGVVGMLVGWPGVGKSTLTLGAGISIACGADWLGWHVAEIGRVLFATAEERHEQIARRLYRAVRGLGLDRSQRDALLDRFVPWSLRGEQVALVHGESSGYAPTPFSLALREHVASLEYALVIVDPLSRFAGPDTETSNAAGTAFVRELEALTRAPSEPTVLFSHHVSKGGDLENMFAARGSSSLSGGVKWQVNVKRVENERGRTWGVALKSTKSNYAPEAPVVNMKWEPGGVLRLATVAERRANDAAVERAQRAKEHAS